jgi:O-antigen/teichoic acid export membrane protein
VVALAYVFQGAYRFMVGGIYVEKKTYYIGMISAISLVANLILNYVLIRPYGGMGAAWATVFSFFLMAGLAYIVSKRVYPVPYSLGSFLISVVIAALMYLGAVRMPVSSVVLSAALKIVILAAFPLALYMIGFFKKNEVKRVVETAHALWATYGWGAVGFPEQ